MSTNLGLFKRLRLGMKLASGLSEEEAGILARVMPGGYKSAPYRGVSGMLKAYSRSPWVRAAVAKVGDAVGGTAWRLFALRSSTSGKYLKDTNLQASGINLKELALGNLDVDGELVPIVDHPALRLLNSSNPMFPGNIGRQQTAVSLELTGEAHWYLDPEYEGGNTVPERFWLLPSNWVQGLPAPDAPYWDIKTPAWEGRLPYSTVFRFVTPDPVNPYGRGSGHLRAFGDEIDTDQFAATYTKNWFLNSARPDLLITANDLQPADTRRMETSWLQTLQSFRRAHKPFFLPKDVNVHQLSPKFSDMEMRPLRAWERDVIVQGLGIPPEVLGIVENSNRATIEAADYIMAKYVTTPRLELMRTFLQYLLLPIYDDRLVLAYESPIEEDREYQLEVMKAQPHVFSVGTWKRQAGVEPEDGDDDTYTVPFNVKVQQGLTPTEDPLKAAAKLRALRAEVVASLTTGCACDQDAAQGRLASVASTAAATAPPTATGLVPAAKQVGGEGNVAAAMGLSEEMQKEIVRAFMQLRNEIDYGALMAAFDSGNIEAAMRLLDEATVAASLEDSVQVLRQAVVLAGEAAAAELASYLGTAIAFTLTNPNAVEFLELFGADMVTNVTEETRDAIREALRQAYADGRSPRDAAKMVEESIGLTKRDIKQRNRLIADMLDAGATQAEVDEFIGKWTEAKIRYRAQVIVNNELVEAGNAGQEMLWDQAAADGLIDPNAVKRQWVVTPDDRLCRLCSPMAGQQTGLYEPWQTALGPVNTPNQIHVRCRCTEVLVVKG